MIVTSIAGMIIGLPTLRLRGDYIAIVTLAFGEIIGTLVGQRLGDPSVERADADRRQPRHLGAGPAVLPRDRDVRPAEPETLVLADIGDRLIVRVRRLPAARLAPGRAWIALREDEVAAVSMGIPLVKTKLLAYAIGAAFGGMAGAFLADFDQTVNASQFPFTFSIFVSRW